MNSFSTLRAVANRLNSTPIEQLPHQVGFFASSILDCKDLLQNAAPSNDQSVVLHKLKTRISALLQDRTADGRFAGIVIAKALIEAGGTTFLSESGSWVRGLISCINKPDPTEIRRLSIVAITRFYLLTADHQALVREITTPTLPAFISATLGAIKPGTTQNDGKTIRSLSPLLEVVLPSWHILIEHFASTIRPNAASIKSICLSLISDDACPKSVRSAAHDVLARLHFCAPKNNVASEWSQICSQAIEAAHDTADLVFRAVVEDWSPAIARVSKVTKKQKSAGVPATSQADVMGRDSWSGISSGCATLARYVDILRHQLTDQHAQEMKIPLGGVIDLTARLSAVTPPTARFALKTNNEITRDEREELWLNLPRVHAAVLSLFELLASTFGSALSPVCKTISTQLWDIFEAESGKEIIRAQTYELINTLLAQGLLPLTKNDSASFKRLIQHCCDDLLAQAGMAEGMLTAQANGAPNGKATPTLTLDGPNKTKHYHAQPGNPALRDAAYHLLPALLTHAPLQQLAGHNSLRSQLDQTAIFLCHHEAILASVMNPARPRTDSKTGRPTPAAPSLMPFLARSMERGNHGGKTSLQHLATAALLRPRMPVIRATNHSGSIEQDGEVDEEEEEEEEEEPMNGHDLDEQNGPEADQDTNMNDNVSAAEPNAGPLSNHHDLQTYANAQKRDFTTLLEESTDAQLAHNGSADLGGNDAFPVDGSALKRPRLESGSALVVEEKTTEDREQEMVTEQGDLQAQQTSKSVLPPVGSFSKASTAGNRSATESTKGKEKASYDSDSDDSDMPPIDATLVGFTDSEDEDE